MKEARIFLALLVVFSLALMLTGQAIAQTPTAKIIVKGVTPRTLAEYSDPKPFTSVSSGLPNVGVGQNVWLEAQGRLGSGSSVRLDTLVSATWTILSKPIGSLAEIIYTDTAGGLQGLTAGMVPDIEGQYEIGLTVTNIHAATSAQSTMFINAATWVGVGGITADAVYPQCGSCHTDKVTDWLGTNHSTGFSRKLDDATGHFAGYCVSCHTVGYDLLPTAANNGFDDVATSTGWVFPAVLQSGNWESMKTNYPAAAALANIQCENCHGPGSQHGGMSDNNKMVSSIGLDACAQCHDAPPYHTLVKQWSNSRHAIATAEGANIEYTNRTNCSRCHTGQGYIREVVDGQASTAPYPDVQPITCATCHDPHDASNPAQLRRQSLADACTGCHTTRFSGQSGLHHAHQGQMLIGIDGTPYSGQSGTVGDWTGWELAGYEYLNSSHSDIADRCVQCHMAAAPDSATAEHLGGHTFSIFWDNDTPADESDDVINPTGCVECHGPTTVEFVHQSQQIIRDLLEELRVLLPHRTSGDTTQPVFPQNSTGLTKAAAYNYYFVMNDGSFGVHNHKYSEGLLRASIEQVKLGAGAAQISLVNDVPNDQGKQVLVVWDKFPAESFSIDPVLSYGIWRKDVGVTPAAGVKVKNIREMFSKPATGGQYSLYGDVWTFVGTVPKAGLAQYSFASPTLFDSTVDGAKWTTFYVTGHTANPYVMYASAPDSGYSIDNLAPAPPAGLAAHIATSTVQLTWLKSNDTDFKYFAVYRGTTPNFDPTGTEPVAKISETSYDDAAVTEGNTYYYKLAAYDFSGNVSSYSNELEVVVLGIEAERGIPTDYALKQNYPNPFNPSTTLKYQLPTATHVRVTIYNTLGVEIATLVNGTQDAGYYSVTWDGKDNSGRTVSSGIYLYKLEAGDFSAVRKMVLMK